MLQPLTNIPSLYATLCMFSYLGYILTYSEYNLEGVLKDVVRCSKSLILQTAVMFSLSREQVHLLSVHNVFSPVLTNTKMTMKTPWSLYEKAGFILGFLLCKQKEKKHTRNQEDASETIYQSRKEVYQLLISPSRGLLIVTGLTSIGTRQKSTLPRYS